jgi:peptidoglycan/LPS O-acetylase OafA/YrhL
MRYMPQLDALRAFAAGLVVVYHFSRPVRHTANLGAIGVRVFFVLSGFLITGILLHSRTLLEQEKSTAGTALRRFYIRRLLRIFPLYYFALGIALIWQVSGAREGFGWHALYLSNVYFIGENFVHPGRWGGAVGHLWSLAVEEQFYLVWPWVILFTPRRLLPVVVLGVVGFAPLFRLVATAATGNDAMSILPFGCLDTLGLGAYLALTFDPGFKSHRWVRSVHPSVVWIGLPLLAVYLLTKNAAGWELARITVFDLAVGLPAVWLIARAAVGFPGLPGRILEAAPLRYLGTISYGIYVYHAILPDLLPRLVAQLGYPDLLAPLGDQTLPYLLFYGTLTVGVAALSWRWFEGPINRWKDVAEQRFAPMPQRRRVRQAGSA